MKIVLNMILHTLVQEPVALVQALSGEDTYWNLAVHSTDPDVTSAAQALERDGAGRVHVEYVGFNQGAARAWNDGIVRSLDMGADVVILSNDDIMASRQDLLKLAQGAMEHRDAFMVTINGLHVEPNEYASMQIAFGAFNSISFDTIGALDEGLQILYHEDVDYFYRAERAGLHAYNVGDSGILHLGSRTMRRNSASDRQIRAAVPLNEQYMIRKWNGVLGSPKYFHPFDDPEIGQKIEFANRHNPYGPKYDRTDYDAVQKL